MRALGYTEGRDFEMEYRYAEGYLERLPALAEEAVRSGSDVIVVGYPQAAVAAKDATKTIPIVGVLLDDPVALGLIKSDAKPGGNVTGLLSSLPGLPAKQLELARDVIPDAARIGLLVNPTNVSVLILGCLPAANGTTGAQRFFAALSHRAYIGIGRSRD
jgi:putative ABC transport system substrate-binding protein